MAYKVLYHRLALKDVKKLSLDHRLEKEAKGLINIIKDDPYQNPPPYKHLAGDMKGLISRRINLRHRLVYQVREEDKAIIILRMWSHYE